MRPSERRNKIMERLSFRRHDTMQNLVDEFGVSWDTIEISSTLRQNIQLSLSLVAGATSACLND